jgi:hypothetical protein
VKGRLIRHALPRLAATILSLAVPVVETPFRAPLMAAVGAAVLLPTCFGAATRATVALPAITMSADPEHRIASPAATNALPEKPIAWGHVLPETGLDNGSRSWQVSTSIPAW